GTVPFRWAKAPSGTSSRSRALRALASKPWQGKQASARIGCTSRLNWTGDSAVAGLATASRSNGRRAYFMKRRLSRLPLGSGCDETREAVRAGSDLALILSRIALKCRLVQVTAHPSRTSQEKERDTRQPQQAAELGGLVRLFTLNFCGH